MSQVKELSHQLFLKSAPGTAGRGATHRSQVPELLERRLQSAGQEVLEAMPCRARPDTKPCPAVPGPRPAPWREAPQRRAERAAEAQRPAPVVRGATRFKALTATPGPQREAQRTVLSSSSLRGVWVVAEECSAPPPAWNPM